MNLFDAVACKRVNFVDDGDLFTLVLADKDGNEFVITGSLKVAGEMAALLSASIATSAKAGRKIPVPRIPDPIVEYVAERASDDAGGVLIFLRGECSSPLFGRMTPADAKRLAALLQMSAEPQAKEPATRQ